MNKYPWHHIYKIKLTREGWPGDMCFVFRYHKRGTQEHGACRISERDPLIRLLGIKKGLREHRNGTLKIDCIYDGWNEIYKQIVKERKG